MEFNELGIIQPILRAIAEEGYETPSPIQEQAIPTLLQGRDFLGCAQTGTGKTAAFSVPILQTLYKEKRPRGEVRRLRALILTPTRELAAQICDSFRAYGRYTGLKTTVIFGGVSQNPQVQALKQGVDILVATPGRLIDLLNQRVCDLTDVDMFVLDEADRMLDMGFLPDVKKIIARVPNRRQTLLFSATMPTEIAALSATILRDHVTVSVTPVSSAVESVEHFLYFVDKKNKNALLLELLQDPAIVSALVFTRTKHGANKLQSFLEAASVSARAIHGNKSQTARQDALSAFKAGQARVLVATDIAARGIDIEQLSHVINYNLPNEPETYVHRIGRTGRAGLSGIAISFCDFEEKAYLKDIRKLTGVEITEIGEHTYPMQVFEIPPPAPRPPRPPRNGQPAARPSAAPAKAPASRSRYPRHRGAK
ncbi:MAG: DEAD/DEAH box helicase [Oscillospiraceae bacterium]|jgi:ATP-dependent RNA helicase RhlE|nr:DEAD/DEAH box helicase [Oscillospiraceae bacterium]